MNDNFPASKQQPVEKVATQATNPALPNSVMMSPVDIHFQRERMSQMMTMASTMVKAGCFGKDVQNEFQAFVKIQSGVEMGMQPMEAMNSLYIVNGKVTIWGAAISKKIREHGWKIEYLNESDSQVTIKVSKNSESHEYTATKAQLLKLGSKAAGFALADKLRWHGLARILRFYIPEVLGSSVSYIKEEIDDLPKMESKPAVRLENAKFNTSDFSAPDDTASGEDLTIEHQKDLEQIQEPNELEEIKNKATKKEAVSLSVEKFCKKIAESKNFDELNSLKESFMNVKNKEKKLSNDEIKKIWFSLGDKLRELKESKKEKEEEVATAEDVQSAFM